MYQSGFSRERDQQHVCMCKNVYCDELAREIMEIGESGIRSAGGQPGD